MCRPVRDVDLVVEGDALDFSARLAAHLGASAKTHARFATGTLALPGGARLDVAATRRETYAHPGALPSVRAGVSIEEDLGRRDFTINAMAMELCPRRRLLDPFGGRADLSRRVIRALHGGSFLDDPTRALRAVRYANRLRFRIAAPTRRAISSAIAAGAFGRVSGDRVRRELRLILEEPRRGAAVRLLHGLGLDAALDPALGRQSRAAARVGTVESIASHHPAKPTWLCYLLAWMSEAGGEQVRSVSRRLALSGPEGRKLLEWPEARRRMGAGLAARAASEVSRMTRGFSSDEIVAAAASLGAVDRRALLRRGTPAQRLRLRIRGADLLAAGVPAGPAVGVALARTLAAREDGRIAAGQELPFALKAAREILG